MDYSKFYNGIGNDVDPVPQRRRPYPHVARGAAVLGPEEIRGGVGALAGVGSGPLGKCEQRAGEQAYDQQPKRLEEQLEQLDLERGWNLERKDRPERDRCLKDDAGAGVEPVDFEDAVDAAAPDGGQFSYGVLGTAGLCYLTCGLQWGISAYILPAARCDFDLTSAQMGAINAFFMAGGMTSSFVWGVLGDALGRRPVIVVALFADAVNTLCSTLAQSYAAFATFRFLSGFLIGSPSALTFLNMSEFVPARVRATYSLVVGGCWTASWLLLPGLAWLVLPQPWRLHALGVDLDSWRLLLALNAAPALLSALLVLRLPQTPKFLVSQGRQAEALGVLRDMYAANTGRDADEYPVRRLTLPVAAPTQAELRLKSVVSVARRKAADTLALFRAPVLARTALVCAILSANEFGYYGLVLWLPELFSRFDAQHRLHPNESVTVCQLSQGWAALQRELGELEAAQAEAQTPTDATSTFTAGRTACSAAEAIDEAVFVQTLIVSGVCLVAYLVTAPLASRVGRRALPCVLNVAAGILAAAVYFVDSATSNLVVASLFQALVGTANTAVISLTADIYPTRVSAVGVCSAIFAGRVSAGVSNLVMGALLDVSCVVPIFLISGIVIVGGILCVFVQPPWVDVAPNPASTSAPTQRQLHPLENGCSSSRSTFKVPPILDLDARPPQPVDLHVGDQESSALPA